MFDQSNDGSHEVTLHHIHRPGCEKYSLTTGVLRWRREAGVTYELHFAGIYSLAGTAFYNPTHRVNPGVGRFAETDLNNPQWLAETDDGTRVALYGVIETPSSTRTVGTSGNSVSCSFNGLALFAVVDIPLTRMLAFEGSAQEPYRMFFIGSAGSKHHESQEVSFTGHDGTVTTSMRCSTLLADAPRISLVSGNAFVKCQPSGWLGFENPPVSADCAVGAYAEQSFVSFLNGEKVPFCWADRKSEGSVRRTYYGWVRSGPKESERPHHQPLPFLGGVEVFTFSDEVLSHLPLLFQRYVERYHVFDFTTALHPLWTALDHDSVLQDRLALASVSLERTAAYWDNCRTEVLDGTPASNNSVWKQKPLLRALRKCLKATLSKVFKREERKTSGLKYIAQQLRQCVATFITSDPCRSLSEEDKAELRNVVEARINHITAPPNSAKLRAPFLDLGLQLTPEDSAAIQKRNDALHGRQTSEMELSALDEEAECFDRLRMLLTKFVLKFCEYPGPYIDYASRPESGNFEVKRMERTHADSNATM